MEMIWHKTPGKNITVRQNIFFDLSYEIQIILSQEENLPTVIPLIEYVIDMTFLKMHDSLDKYRFFRRKFKNFLLKFKILFGRVSLPGREGLALSEALSCLATRPSLAIRFFLIFTVS